MKVTQIYMETFFNMRLSMYFTNDLNFLKKAVHFYNFIMIQNFPYHFRPIKGGGGGVSQFSIFFSISSVGIGFGGDRLKIFFDFKKSQKILFNLF